MEQSDEKSFENHLTPGWLVLVTDAVCLSVGGQTAASEAVHKHTADSRLW